MNIDNDTFTQHSAELLARREQKKAIRSAYAQARTWVSHRLTGSRHRAGTAH